MDQMPEQTARQKRPEHLWPKGVSGNPQGPKAVRQARCEVKVTEWTKPYGGVEAFTPAELDLLRKAADLYTRRPKPGEDRAKTANTIRQILAQVGVVSGRRREIAEPTGPSLADYIAQRYPADGEGAA
jgi:hypothetical protein